jgi:hypothetical protein
MSICEAVGIHYKRTLQLAGPAELHDTHRLMDEEFAGA